jgi:serine/threonine protein kinase
MDAQPALHPTDRSLHAYGLGKLDDASAEWVNGHLEGCLHCRQRVAALSSDSFIGRLRAARAGPESCRPAVSSTDGLSMLDGRPAPAVPPPPGALPAGLADLPDYEILRELGQGGMGTVFLAQNILMGRLEVLKVVSGHLLKRRGVLERFLGEIRNAARLHHPNVVTAYSVVRAGESLVLAMQYVEGLDLSRLVKARGPLPVANSCNYIHQAALGLQHAHERGMVHRDIKPNNLMLSRQGNRAVIKVVDFGLAKIRSEAPTDRSLTHEGQMLGTPDFIAPEQITDARHADIRADIYSLGCTFYYLLTGRPPFEGTSLYDVLQAHQSRDALPVNLERPEVPVAVAALVAKMMAKEPDRRFEVPEEIAQALMPFFKKGSQGWGESKAEVSQVGQTATGQAEPAVRTAASQSQPTPDRARVIPRPLIAPADTERAEREWASPIALAGAEHPTKPSDAVTAPRRRRPPSVWPAIVAASVIGVLALAVIIYVSTNKGRIKIVVNDPDVVVTLDGRQTLGIEGLGEPITMSVGQHELQAKRGDLEVMTKSFSVRRGQNEPLLVEFERKELGTRKSEGLNPKDNLKDQDATRPPLNVAALTTNRQAQIFHGKWRVEGEDLVQGSAGPGGKSMVFGDESWSDYDFEVEVKGIGRTNVWIFFDYVDTRNHCNFYPGPGNDHGLGTVVDGHVAHKSVPGSLEPDRWYKVKIEVRGPEARCFLDGNEVLYHFEPRLTKGRVGLGSWETVCHFRKIEVRSPNGEALWQGLPALPGDS